MILYHKKNLEKRRGRSVINKYLPRDLTKKQFKIRLKKIPEVSFV